MKNKGIVIFLILLSIVIAGLLISDFRSGRPGRSEANPFALNVDLYKTVDPSLLLYKEIRNIRPGLTSPTAFIIKNDTMYVAGDRLIRIISLSGDLLAEIPLDFTPVAADVVQGKMVLASRNRVYLVEVDGTVVKEWEPGEESTHITALAAAGEYIFIADAGRRRVYRYNAGGDLINEIEGKAEEGDLHGFIVPSPTFDLAVSNDNELWVVNPGLHALENYSFDGRLRSHWTHSGVAHEGFSGCCNPAHFTFLSDGRFVTSEKGLVRIKTYRQSGEYEGMVAAPNKFTDDGYAPDVAADNSDNIYALDFNTKMIRVFTPVD